MFRAATTTSSANLSSSPQIAASDNTVFQAVKKSTFMNSQPFKTSASARKPSNPRGVSLAEIDRSSSSPIASFDAGLFALDQPTTCYPSSVPSSLTPATTYSASPISDALCLGSSQSVATSSSPSLPSHTKPVPFSSSCAVSREPNHVPWAPISVDISLIETSRLTHLLHREKQCRLSSDVHLTNPAADYGRLAKWILTVRQRMMIRYSSKREEKKTRGSQLLNSIKFLDPVFNCLDPKRAGST